MNYLNSFNGLLNASVKNSFAEKALKLFNDQAINNQIYKKYLHHLGIAPHKVKSLEEIPFLPISFFKSTQVVTGKWQAEQAFESSGTTGSKTSIHYVKSLKHYLLVAEAIFEARYGALDEFHILALLPSYLERNNSSLVFMIDYFIKKTNSNLSGFYLNNYAELSDALNKANETNKKVLLIGVTFGLLDFIEQYKFSMPDAIVMETGGMKGRRKELIRDELHNVLKNGFGVNHIHAEYGMTELLSQAYSQKNGRFSPSETMRIMIRDINDPFSYMPVGKTGGVNVIDLANMHSCAFIETQDLGRLHEDGTFEIMGRFDNSDIRGCNLLVS